MKIFSRLKDTYKNTVTMRRMIEELYTEIKALRNEIAVLRSERLKTEDVIYNMIASLSMHDNDAKKSLSYSNIRTLHQLLPVYDVKDRNFIRLGGSELEEDGGYVMIDEFSPSMLAYSFGINRDVSWDKEMAIRNIPCFMYDHTIDNLPEENPLFHWKKTGISGNAPVTDCKTLANLITENDHTNRQDMILKMDIEGAEWDALDDTDSQVLDQFCQMIIEFHDMCNPSKFGKICSVFAKLAKTHCCVHVHGNNWAAYHRVGGLVMPYVLEATFVRKKDHDFVLNNHCYPRENDRPNRSGRVDIELGIWNKDR